MNTAFLQMKVAVKSTMLYKMWMFLLQVTAPMMLERTLKATKYFARKGWLWKYRIDRGRWRKLEMDIDFEVSESV